jgi:hypothetical protein
MHALLYVLCPKDGIPDSKSARGHVFHWLSDNGFTENKGLFQHYYADWFVVGGRWSGELTSAQMDQEKLTALNKEFNEKFGFWISKDVSEEMRREQYRELTQKYFPDYKGFPWTFRDSYKEDGYEDDAQIVNRLIYYRIIKDNLLDQINQEKLWNGGAVIATDMNEKEFSRKPDDLIDKYWAVVVDYHF